MIAELKPEDEGFDDEGSELLGCAVGCVEGCVVGVVLG